MALQRYTPNLIIEIAGEDVTDRLISSGAITTGKSIDYPDFSDFRSSAVVIPLDNQDGQFDHNVSPNFFTALNLPTHGTGASVLIKMGNSIAETEAVFAGQITKVGTALEDPYAYIEAVDMSLPMRQHIVEDFGVTITYSLPNVDGSSTLWTFPSWGRPVVEGSVSLINESETVYTMQGALFSRGSITGSSTLQEVEARCVEANVDESLSGSLVTFSSTDFTPPSQNDFIYRQYISALTTRTRLTAVKVILPAGVDDAVWIAIYPANANGTRASDTALATMNRSSYSASAVTLSATISESAWGSTEYIRIEYFMLELSGGEAGKWQFGYTEHGETETTPIYITASFPLVSSPINIVEKIAISGNMSNKNAEVKYDNNQVLFEAPPNAGAVANIIATWKTNYQYKRPDFLLWNLLKNSDLHNLLNISDDTVLRFGIKQALYRHPTDRIFSSHGRPFFEEFGIPRYLLCDHPSKKCYMAISDQLVEYDEYQDNYTVLSKMPASNAGFTPPNYGSYLAAESWNYPSDIFNSYYNFLTSLSIFNNRIYLGVGNSGTLSQTLQAASFVGDSQSVNNIQFGSGTTIDATCYDNGILYYSINRTVYTYDIATGATTSIFTTNHSIASITLSDTRIYIANTTNSVYVYNKSDYSGLSNSFNPKVSSGGSSIVASAIVYQNGELYLGSDIDKIYVISAHEDDFGSGTGKERVAISSKTINLHSSQLSGSNTTNVRGMELFNQRLYVGTHSPGPKRMNVYYLGLGQAAQAINYKPIQLATPDFEDFYLLCTLTLNGDQYSKDVFNPVRIYKYDKSANALTNELNETTGQPQLAQLSRINGENIKVADNRKNFQAIDHNSKRLIFFRRAQASASGIAMRNETDNTLTDVYTENHGSDDDYGLPYSMDFVLDIRDDGIYVYTFVVKHELDSNGNFSSGSLKIYRKRVQPAANQTEIFSETFSASSFAAMTRYGETSVTVSHFSNSEVGIYDGKFVMACTASQASGYLTLREGDIITLSNSSGDIIVTLAGTPTTGTRNSNATLELAAGDFEIDNPIVDNRSYTVSAKKAYPVSVSDLILAGDKFYFILDYSISANSTGKSELSTVAKTGSGNRTTLRTYKDRLLSARSPVKNGNSYFYLEGGWVRQARDSDDDPIDQYYYPNQGGRLIEIDSSDNIVDHGQIWRNATKEDSPDSDNAIYEGYGLFNSVVSNMIADHRGNLSFIIGYGLPYEMDENLLFLNNQEPITTPSNFHWIQWGQDLATKIESFDSNSANAWALIQNLAQLMDWEIGVGPAISLVDAIQALHSNLSDWSANACIFFRPRSIVPAELRAALTAVQTITSIGLNLSGLPAELAEFSAPPSGSSYIIIINKELFTYTGVQDDTEGQTLTGIKRAQNGSIAAAHAVGDSVYFVDHFVSGEVNPLLLALSSREADLAFLYNSITVAFGAGYEYNTKDPDSITQNNESELNLQNTKALLGDYDSVWAELLADSYLKQFATLKEVIRFTMIFTPHLQPGQLIVLHQTNRVKIQYKPYIVLSALHSATEWQTEVHAREI